MISSMTGFFSLADSGLTCEVRSVNHRFLEVSVRMPDGLRYLEPLIRQICREKLQRGKVDWQLRAITDVISPMQVNSQALDQLRGALNQIAEAFPNAASPSQTDLLGWPGVTFEENHAIAPDAASNIISDAVEGLIATRKREGEALRLVLLEKLGAFEAEVTALQNESLSLIDRQRSRLITRFEELKVDLDSDRLHQEVVLLMQKNDIEEELDRLATHVNEFRDQLNRTHQNREGVGRRLDFLLQEFNRETNTIASKSWDSSLTLRAVEMKVLIEQLREQVQNVE